MEKHRILIISNRIPYPLNDGGSLAIHAMIEGYDKAGWDVFFLAMNTSRHYVPTGDLPPLYEKIRFDSFDINTDVKIVPTLRNFFFSRKPNHADRFDDKNFLRKLKTVIAGFDPEVVQLESIYLATYLPVMRQVTNAKLSLRLHNIEYQIWEKLASDFSPSFKKYYLRDLAARIKRYELNAWKQADLLIPITESDAETVKESIPGKDILVAPFGITQKAGGTAEEQWVGYHIGAMDWIPNAEAVTWFFWGGVAFIT